MSEIEDYESGGTLRTKLFDTDGNVVTASAGGFEVEITNTEFVDTQ